MYVHDAMRLNVLLSRPKPVFGQCHSVSKRHATATQVNDFFERRRSLPNILVISVLNHYTLSLNC